MTENIQGATRLLTPRGFFFEVQASDNRLPMGCYSAEFCAVQRQPHVESSTMDLSCCPGGTYRPDLPPLFPGGCNESGASFSGYESCWDWGLSWDKATDTWTGFIGFDCPSCGGYNEPFPHVYQLSTWEDVSVTVEEVENLEVPRAFLHGKFTFTGIANPPQPCQSCEGQTIVVTM